MPCRSVSPTSLRKTRPVDSAPSLLQVRRSLDVHRAENCEAVSGITVGSLLLRRLRTNLMMPYRYLQANGIWYNGNDIRQSLWLTVLFKAMGKEMQDYEVVRLCLDGRTECFETLVDRYQKLVYSLAWSYLKDPQLAEDASQEAFAKAYRHLASYNPKYRFSTWIARITANTCTDLLRKRRDVCPIEEAFEVTDPEATPEQQVIGRETRDRLETLINQLNPKYKEPLMLYHLSGMTYEEIAEYLKVPMSIVKNRIFRARKMLRQAMED